jgi:uncharacterized protein (TIGR00251 family)
MKEKNANQLVVRLSVRVSPRSSRNAVTSYVDQIAYLHVNAPPVDNAANVACCALIAEVLGIGKSSVNVQSGAKSRNKTLAIEGLSLEIVEQRLAQFCQKV